MNPIITFRVRKFYLVVPLLASVVGCDQGTKTLVRQSLPLTGPLNFLHNMVHLQMALNPGAFLNFGAGLSERLRFWCFEIGVVIFLAGLAFALLRRQQTRPHLLIGLTLMLSGGIGNLLDRLYQGGVTDFLLLTVGSLRTGIFNFADVAVTLGGLLIFIGDSPTLKRTSRGSDDIR
jgi:signal peptidase II